MGVATATDPDYCENATTVGGLHNIYEMGSSAHSRYEIEPLPKWIRDPDSNFSAVWDLVQVILLLYVSIIVPLRSGFDIETPLWSFGFFFDMVVDIYFLADIVINFRTAVYLRDGTREERIEHIATHYLRGWFTIDFLSVYHYHIFRTSARLHPMMP